MALGQPSISPVSTVVFLVNLCLLTGQEIIRSPKSKTVYVDHAARFECEFEGGIATWRVNGTIFGELPREIRENLTHDEPVSNRGFSLLLLTIPGRPEYNMTTVQCVTRDTEGKTYESENVILAIQGKVAAVANVNAAKYGTSVSIFWIAPFSLDVTDVDPDIWYSVLVHNVTDSDRPTAINCTDCTNITETCYTFSPDHLSLSHKYNFTVIPFNGAGQGESYSHIEHFTEDENPTAISVEVDQLNGRMIVKCVFRCSTSNKCYVQVVGTEMVEEQCLEGEGEVIHNFTGLVAGLYIVTVDSGEVSCSANSVASCSANGVADYITVATLREQHFTSHTPSISDTGPILQSKSNDICVKGIGIGVAIGTASASFVFVTVILFIKIISKFQKIKRNSSRDKKLKIALGKNEAYESHSLPTSHKGTQPGSETLVPVYEEL